MPIAPDPLAKPADNVSWSNEVIFREQRGRDGYTFQVSIIIMPFSLSIPT